MTLQDKSQNSISDFDTIMPFRLKFCMQGFFTQTTDAIALKLNTLIGHRQMTLQDKSQNSISDFDTMMPLFALRILVKDLHARYYHGHISVTTNDTELKLHSYLQGCQNFKLDNS